MSWTRQRLGITSWVTVTTGLMALAIFFVPYKLGTGPAIRHIGNQTVVYERFEIRTVGSRLTEVFIPGVKDPRLTIPAALIGVAVAFALTYLMELAVQVARRGNRAAGLLRVKRRLRITSNATVVIGLVAAGFFLMPLHVEELPAKRITPAGEIVRYDYYETQSIGSWLLWDRFPPIDEADLTKETVPAGVGASLIVIIIVESLARFTRSAVRGLRLVFTTASRSARDES